MSQPDTRIEAYRQTKDDGTQATLRRQIARRLSERSMTTHELTESFEERSANAIRPRVHELVRMGCVERRGTRTNPSGHEAKVHHLTELGERYAAGEIDPDPAPTLAECKGRVLRVARAVVSGEADMDVLQAAVEYHDEVADRLEGEDGD